MKEKGRMAQFLAAKSTASSSKPESTKHEVAEVKLCGFLAEHNIAFSAMDHLVDVLKDCFPDSNV